MAILVDILLPTYNGEAYVKEQINSILNQTYTEIRLLIRDDGSKDKTVAIVKEIAKTDSRVSFIEDAAGNLGLVKNIEHLLRLSTAPLIMFSDQDDVWLTTKIAVFVENALLEGTNSKLLIHSNCWVTDFKLENKRLFKGDSVLNKGLKSCFFNYYVQGASSMITQSLKGDLLPFPESAYLHDRYIHLISEVTGKRIYINQPLMLYRQHDSNLVGSKSLLKKIKNNLLLKSRFFIPKDAALFHDIYGQRFPENKDLELYAYLTNSTVNRFVKMFLIFRHKIPIRFKELFLLCLKN